MLLHRALDLALRHVLAAAQGDVQRSIPQKKKKRYLSPLKNENKKLKSIATLQSGTGVKVSLLLKKWTHIESTHATFVLSSKSTLHHLFVAIQ